MERSITTNTSERQGGALFISTTKGYAWFQRLYEDAQNLDDWEHGVTTITHTCLLVN